MAICGTWFGRHQRPNSSCINNVRSHQFPRSVVLLAKSLAPTDEVAVAAVGAPKALVEIIMAAVVLLPEGIAAYQAAGGQPACRPALIWRFDRRWPALD
jgi:hypothetical protein